MKNDITWTDEEWKTHVSEAIGELSYAWDQFATASTFPRQASALERLANAMHDVKTWHPDYDYETGEIVGLYEEDPS